MRTGITAVTLAVPGSLRAGVDAAREDVRSAGRVVGTLDGVDDAGEQVVARDAALADPEPKAAAPA
jgi:valyl-tRNA synthetase